MSFSQAKYLKKLKKQSKHQTTRLLWTVRPTVFKDKTKYNRKRFKREAKRDTD